ncbi:unnamed protein product [Orchesella dallaii]|uniref:Uncharacterized protein n=1 Tax=Orchesella dallaii TaxID=48710 RepID=A0ABP1RQM5_9HEXA
MAKYTLNFGILFFFLQMKSGISTELIETSRKYPQPKTLRTNPLLISNLNSQLEVFKTCLVHLINYKGIDILPPKYPIVLSRYFVLNVGYQKHADNRTYSWKEVRTFKIEELPSNSTRMTFCEPILQYQRHCYPEDQLQDLSVRTKSWLCEAHFYLLTPSPREDPFFYEEIFEQGIYKLIIPRYFENFWHDTQIEKFKLKAGNAFNVDSGTILVKRPKYQILVVEGNNLATLYDQMIMWVHAMSILRSGAVLDLYTKTRHHLFVIGTEMKKNHINLKTLIFLCRFCTKCDNFMPIYVTNRVETVSRSLLGRMIDFVETRRTLTNIFWDMVVSGNWHSSFIKSRAGNEYEKFINFYNKNHMHSSKDSKRGLDLLRFQIEASIIKHILRVNESGYLLKGPQLTNWKCSKDFVSFYKMVPIMALIPKGGKDAGTLDLHPTKLKFVSCGTPEIYGFDFAPLTSIFDIYIWVMIIVTVIGISAYFSWVSSESIGILETTYSCLRTLLEQGDCPLRDKLLSYSNKHSRAGRWVFCGFLLMAVVLSNGYKNKNISEITLPRKEILFDKFDMLIKHNFKIFTRAIFQYAGGDFREDFYTMQKKIFFALMKPRPPFDTHDITNVFKSEVFGYASIQVSSLDWCVVRNDTSDRARYIMDNTELLPNWYEVLRGSEATSAYGMDVLEPCNRTALFLPDIEAHIAYTNLLAKKKNVYLGKEEDLHSQFYIFFGRWVHPAVLWRIEGLLMSGILDWWTKVFVNFMTGIQSKSEVEFEWKPSDIFGNIFVVFVVYIVSITVAIMIFLLEVASVRARCKCSQIKFSNVKLRLINNLFSSSINRIILKVSAIISSTTKVFTLPNSKHNRHLQVPEVVI